MSTLVERRPCNTSRFTQLEQSPTAPANQAARSTRAPSGSPEDGWDEIINQLIDFSRLPDDWDGEGSAAPDRGVVAAATKLAAALRSKNEQPPDRVSASVNGTIYFEWYPSDGFLDIEVMSPVDAERRWLGHGATVAEVTPIAII